MQKIIDKVVAQYYGKMLYRDIAHPKILLTFSAVPGSGKTTLAKKLASDLKAGYIRADDIRHMLRQAGIDPISVKTSDITRRIASLVLEKDANKFIILDASMDRTWDDFFAHALKMNATPFVVRMNVSDVEVAKRLKGRDGEIKDKAEMTRFRSDFLRCKEHVMADIELGNEYDYNVVLTQVKDGLKDLL